LLAAVVVKVDVEDEMGVEVTVTLDDSVLDLTALTAGHFSSTKISSTMSVTIGSLEHLVTLSL